MRFHLPALPGRPVTAANSSCAYTGKVRRFATMMSARGHEVLVYGGGGFDGGATEFVDCYPDSEPLPFEASAWRQANLRAAAAIEERAQPDDFLCIIGGVAQQLVADSLPELMAVEYGVGYEGIFSEHRVFESYAWMHLVYGSRFAHPMSDTGSFYDAVIPNYFDTSEFEHRADKEDYVLYLGRLIDRKGVHVAEEAAQRAQRPLLIAGAGDYEPQWGECLGEVGPGDRAELLAGASALLCPTLYVEPFGGVAVEAMLSGTPVVCTDWGAFTETVVQGVTGWRCRTLGEFTWALEHVGELDPLAIASHARLRYSLEAVAPQYERYFERLATLRGDGWYTSWEGLSREPSPRASNLSSGG